MRAREIPLIVILSALMVCGAAAQQQPQSANQHQPGASTQGSAARPAVPTGHRQPRMSDLPPALAKKEAGQPPETDPSHPAIDQDLHICSTC